MFCVCVCVCVCVRACVRACVCAHHVMGYFIELFAVTNIYVYKSPIYTQLNNVYKIGLLHCKNGQSLEEEMYNNGMCVCLYVCLSVRVYVFIVYVCMHMCIHAVCIYIYGILHRKVCEMVASIRDTFVWRLSCGYIHEALKQLASITSIWANIMLPSHGGLVVDIHEALKQLVSFTFSWKHLSH